MTWPAGLVGREQWQEWLEDRGVDLVAARDGEWGLGLIPSIMTLVPGDDVNWQDAATRVAEVLAAKAERSASLKTHHDERVDFVILPKDIQPPVQFAFRTAAGSEGLLRITTKSQSVGLEWKVTKPAATTEAAFSEHVPSRTILIPDADTKDAAVVLDLASGEMLKLPWKNEQEGDREGFHPARQG